MSLSLVFASDAFKIYLIYYTDMFVFVMYCLFIVNLVIALEISLILKICNYQEIITVLKIGAGKRF
jgi:hypothetical protein